MTPHWEQGSYGYYFLRLPNGFSVVVGWDSLRPKHAPEMEGFKVSFEAHTLKERFRDLPEAKAAGMTLARRILTQTLAALDEVTL